MNFYSVDEAKEMLKISDTTLYKYIRAGKIPAVRLGRQYRISEETIRAFAEGRGGDPIAPTARDSREQPEGEKQNPAG